MLEVNYLLVFSMNLWCLFVVGNYTETTLKRQARTLTMDKALALKLLPTYTER